MCELTFNNYYKLQLFEKRNYCVTVPSWTDLDLNTCLRNEKPAINRLSYGMLKHPTYLQQAHNKDTHN
jgi:hypothetical protein